MSSKNVCFVTCQPGLEPLLHAEMKSLGLGNVERQVGGVLFRGGIRDTWKANYRLRTAIRVLWRLHRFEAKTPEDLYHGAREISWQQFIKPSGTILVDAQSKNSALTHTRFIEQKVKDAVVDQFRGQSGERPSISKENPDLKIHVHLAKDRCTISADTSGDSLHKRGWRVYQGRAPLSETLAAAMVLFSGWDGRSPFLDPFCGSGTILIEAAMIAAGISPGRFRDRFGFEAWLDHDPNSYSQWKKTAEPKVAMPRKLILRGWDQDEKTVDGARKNLTAAGVDGAVEIEKASIGDFHPKKGWNGWVVSNLPFGQRVGKENLSSLLKNAADRFREECAGYHGCFLSGTPEFSKSLGGKPSRQLSLLHGALPCELLRYDDLGNRS